MLFKASRYLAAIAVVVTLIQVITAVDIVVYQKKHCTGRFRKVCRNIGSRNCCSYHGKPPWEASLSGKCIGCTGADKHIGHVTAGSFVDCGNERLSIHGDGCLEGLNSGFDGHSWRRTAIAARTEEFVEDSQCVGIMEPNFIEVGDQWFQVNETMPRAHVLEIHALARRGASFDEIPDYLKVLETTSPLDE